MPLNIGNTPLLQSISSNDRYSYDGLPPELAAEEQAINRKQQIANYLFQQGLQPAQGQMVGRFYVPPSPMQGVAGLAQVLAGVYGSHQADQARSGVADKNKSMLADVVSAYKQKIAPTQTPAQGPGAPVQTAQPWQGFTPEELKQPTALYGTQGDAFQKLFDSRSPAYFKEGPRPTTETPKTPEERQQAIVETLLASTHPQAQRMGKDMLNFEQASSERDQQRDFLSAQKDLDRENQKAIAGSKVDQLMTMGLIGQATGKQLKEELMASEERQNKSTNEARLEAARIAAGSRENVASMKSGANRPMSATAQKELIQTEEELQGSHQAIKSLQSALDVNDKAMGFAGAGALASAGSLLPQAMRPAAVDATVDLDNILTGSALPQLKAIFGGMPTEGERKVLLDIQGSSGKTPSQRKLIIDRAIQAAQNRIKFGQQKAGQLRQGTYFTGEGGLDTTVDNAAPAASASGGGLSPAEQQELDSLRKRHGR